MRIYSTEAVKWKEDDDASKGVDFVKAIALRWLQPKICSPSYLATIRRGMFEPSMGCLARPRGH